MSPLSAIVLMVAAGSAALTLGLIFLRRIRRPGADPAVPAITAGLSASGAIWLSRYDANCHDALLFVAGVALVVALAGFMVGRCT